MEGKSVVFIAVEELDEAEALGLAAAEVAVVLEEVEHLTGADVGVGVAVQALEGRVGSEISDRAESLAGGFEAAFAIANSDKEVLQPVF